MITPKPKTIVEDFTVRDNVLAGMRERIGVDTKREGVHLSSLVGCMLKGWHTYRIDQGEEGRAAVLGETPNKTALVWCIGHSHEAIFGATAIKGEPQLKDGITFTPDFWVPLEGAKFTLAEMKSTRKSANKTVEDMPHYIAQVAGYCAANNLTECLVFILHIMGDYNHDHPPEADLRVWRLTFSKKELTAWWSELKKRRDTIIGINVPILDDNSPMYGWECSFCKVRELIGCAGGAEYQHELELAAGRLARKKQVQILG